MLPLLDHNGPARPCGAVKRILKQAQAPKSVSQIRKELTGSLRISSKELALLLDEMTERGEIFSWPQKKLWDRDPRTALPDLILAFMAKSQVAAASKIKASLKLPLEMVQAALNELVDRGTLYLWQPGKTPYFGLTDPCKTALDAILNALAGGPLTERELIGRIRKRLPGYRKKDLKEHLSGATQIYEYPRFRKIKTRYGLQPPEPGPYLGRTVQDMIAVRDLLAPFKVSLERIYEALQRELGLEPTAGAPSTVRTPDERAPRETQRLILEGIARLQPPGQRRALVSIRELRRSVSLKKSVFDRTVLSLAVQGEVALHHHDFPSSLSPDERDELVRDEQGTFYVGIVPKGIP
mgnify:CR=1 FL=1